MSRQTSPARVSFNAMRQRAAAFSLKYADAVREEGDAQEFEVDFLNIFGVTRRQVATFEKKVQYRDGSGGSIDLFWKGMILIEMKSRGKDLDAAYQQAKAYADALPPDELPRVILICDFAHFHVYDLDNDAAKIVFTLDELANHVELFAFLAGYEKQEYGEQNPADVKAAELMGRLHDLLKETGYGGHGLEIYLVRMLFCLFAEDTGIFPKDAFLNFLRTRTKPDGSDVALHVQKIFETLNKPENRRTTTLDEQLRAFPYVNGQLFDEQIASPDFDEKMRDALIECAEFDWSKISPAIFGAMFQSVMNPQERRNLGAHYTSEANILKLIGPLFLDDLQAELRTITALRTKNVREERLHAFHEKLASLKFLDPACGCGNFLIVTYRELRELEIKVIEALRSDEIKRGTPLLDLELLVRVNVNQFYGIEIEEFPSLIAQTALWLIDHQMNNEVRAHFGKSYLRIPLTTSPTIRCANALPLDWESVVPKTELSYILGNPPFVGFTYMNAQQKSDVALVFESKKNTGVLDYVTCWYKKAAEYIQGTKIECAFISTKSICQGEAVAPLWKLLFNTYGLKINFAHQTFKWSNEARGKAAVLCVIVGFSTSDRPEKKLFLYDTVTSEPRAAVVKQINAYLVDAPNVIVESRTSALCKVSPMLYGNKPVDGGHLIIEADEYADFIRREPLAKKYIRKLLGSEEFINNKERWCLWFVDANPSELKKMPLVLERIECVKKFRLASPKIQTQEHAQSPSLFVEVRHPETDYVLVPRVSSERRKYIPIGFISKDVIVNDSVQIIPNATLYEFGVLTSAMHMAWNRYICGYLGTSYRYSANIVYNNFPWCDATDKQRSAIEDAAQAVLDARAQFPDSSLADLYDPNTMPRVLLKSHEKLDRTVEKAYGRTFTDDAARVAFLFERYQSLTADLISEPAKRKRKPVKQKKEA
ncbi:MAG: DNA methyltransferase [Thermoguttaceae bacterium]